MLIEAYRSKLADILIPADRFRPYPKAGDREAWNKVAPGARSRWVDEAERRIGYSWPSLPAVRYMDYARNGNRTRYQDVYFERRRVLAALVMAECLEGEGRFLDDITNGIWSLCEESYWCVPAHKSLSRASEGDPLPDVNDPVIDLFAAETAGLLAWTDYLLKEQLDGVSRYLSLRIRNEVKTRILDPYLQRDDFWWFGHTRKHVNNWTPWILSNCLSAFFTLESDPQRRVQAVDKALASLDIFLNVYHDDGGCDEGPGYWNHAGASLFDCLELLHEASDGRIHAYNEPLIQNIGRYIYKVHIAENRFVNFADGDAKLSVAADAIYRYGVRIGDAAMQQFGLSVFREESMIGRFVQLFRALPALFLYDTLTSSDASPPYVRDVWMGGIQVMAAREQAGTVKGLYLAAKGGHNQESHNHNDVGHFIVYYDGIPFLIDAGVEEYTSKTFGPDLYDIWTMQSAYHNLPTVNGWQQAPGAHFHATEAKVTADDRLAELSLQLAAAYPAEAGVRSWRRTYHLHRAEERFVEIVDDFALQQPVSDLALGVLTLPEPHLITAGVYRLRDHESGVTLLLEFDASEVNFKVERIDVTDLRLKRVWGERLHRIVLMPKQAVTHGLWTLRVRKE